MQAIVYRDYGAPLDVLKLEKIEKPVPGDDEVLLKVHAASLNPLDWKPMKGGFLVSLLFGKPKNKIPGADVSGQVEAVGKNANQFKAGDQVFGTCLGACAEYAISRSVFGLKSALVLKPDQVTFGQAAAAPVAALTALQGLRDKGRIQQGQTVLINGAAGGVGTFAVQIARAFGAEVTGVCSTRNVEMVRSIGAQRVVDYTQDDFTKGGQRYDLLFDCVGNHPLSACRGVLNPKGKLIMVGPPNDITVSALLVRLLGALLLSPFVSRKMIFFIASMKGEDLTTVGALMAAGKVTSVIDRCYPLREVPEAMRYAAEGHARGKVIITVEPATQSLISA